MRRAFPITALLSVVIALALDAIWVRSLYYDDWVVHEDYSIGPTEFFQRTRSVTSNAGQICYQHFRFALPTTGPFGEANLQGALEWEKTKPRKSAFFPDEPMVAWHWDHSVSDGRWPWMSVFATKDERNLARWLGFGYQADSYAQGTLKGPIYFTDYEFRIPYWFLVLATLFLPSVWARRKWLQHRRLRRGLCPACGYDLRATPGRCSECGWGVDEKLHQVA